MLEENIEKFAAIRLLAYWLDYLSNPITKKPHSLNNNIILRSLIQENKSFTKVVTLLFVLACIIINPLRAQLDNRIFSFYPQPFYFIQKAPLYKLGSMTEYEIAIDSAVEMTQIDSIAISIEPAADSTISDTTIYPPLSALNEVQEPDTFEIYSL